MDWFTVHGSLLFHKKWRRLSPVGRGAWITLMLIGHAQPGSKRWQLGQPDDVLDQLREQGFRGTLAVEAMAELVRRRLLDIDEDNGMVSIHDGAINQRFPSDLPERRTARSQKAKAKDKAARLEQAGTAGNGEERGGTAGNGDRQTEETNKRDRQNGADGAAPVPLEFRPTNLAEAIQQITGRMPSEKEWKWVNDLCESYGREHISEALWEVKGAQTPKYLLSRISHHFRDGEPLNKEEAL